MSTFLIPKYEAPHMGVGEVQRAIAFIKTNFQQCFAEELSLLRVSAPLFVYPDTGMNDNLNGVERPVEFRSKFDDKKTIEVVQSLAKWKRYATKKYEIQLYKGIYADMNAIRRDEILSNIHSVYVDQWDWEKVISITDRNESYLKETVNKIFSVIRKIEQNVIKKYPVLGEPWLPEKIEFIKSQELENLYPDKSSSEREDIVAEKYKAVFIQNIGAKLKSGKPHDNRSPDYDDWQLNGDIIFWNPLLGRAFEISSMSIRVDAESLENQCKLVNASDRLNRPFHRMILNNELPYTIGGGIGQSRLCMYFMKRTHIGEVQVSVWDQATLDQCKQYNITLL